MSNTVTSAEYERLADAELAAAAIADTVAARRAHLDKAAVFATLGETVRQDIPPPSKASV